MRDLQAGEVGHRHILALEYVGRRRVLLKSWERRQPDVYGLTRFPGFHYQVGGGILQVAGTGVNLTIAQHVIGNELGKADRGIRVERKSLVQTNCDVLGRSAIAGSGGEHQSVDLSGPAIARLIKAYAAINQWIVDHDLLGYDRLPVLQNHQIRPPAFRSAVGIVLLTSAVTADRKRQVAFGAVLGLHLARLLPAGQHDECTPAVERIDDAAEKNQKQTEVHDIDCHFRKAVALTE